MPDLNNDDMISYDEFVVHSENYQKGFPNAAPEDFPNFEMIDTNNDKVLSFDEWLFYIMQLRSNKQ